jgi:hypothetical protein
MKFICCQPAIPYYTWQVETMINNFISKGINPNSIEIVCSYRGEVPEIWRKLASHYNTVRFFFYEDTRINPSYISSVRPHILKKHWLKYPELAKETFLYHDCDIILTNSFNISDLLNDDICYVSDTVSYIGANYIRSKGEDYLDLMTSIVNVDKNYISDREQDSGGAQYLIKNVDYSFWEKVYYDSETLYRLVTKKIGEENPDHALQIWCADMWAVLWNLWFYSKEVKVTEKLSFSWGTSHISEFDKHPIYHNAGVTTSENGMFYKAQWINKIPYNNIKLDELNTDMCCYNYAKEIVNLSKSSILI